MPTRVPDIDQQTHLLYTVSWDAQAEEADNNIGISTLHVAAFDPVNGRQL